MSVETRIRREPVRRDRAQPHGRLRHIYDEVDPVTGEMAATEGQPLFVRRNGKLVRRTPAPSEGAGASTAAAELGQATADEGPELAGKKSGAFGRFMIGLFVLSIVSPLFWQIGGLRMTPYLMILFISFIPLMGIWLMRSQTRIIPSDILMIGFNCWVALALIRSAGFAPSVQPIGVSVLTTTGAYMMGRILVRDAASMRMMARIGIFVLILIMPFLMLEAVTGSKPILQAARMLGGSLNPVDIGKRLGLYRTQGPFEHPILMGVFCASLMSLAVYCLRERAHITRWLGPPVVFVCSVLSLSTGALLSLNLQFGLMLWGRMFRKVPKRWKILSSIIGVAYVAVDLVSTKTPFHVFVNYATFSSSSSYNRILIWEFGTANVAQNPFFGVGMGDWQRPGYMSNSMDNFWLLQAVRYGLPALIMLLAAIILIMVRMGQVDYKSEEMIMMRRGVIFSIIATMVAIFSVHLWNASYVWFMFLVGASAWLGIPAAPPGKAGVAQKR